MTTSNTSSVLKDVVAYVDVWSSDKTANYSKPFIQQLQEMGAQVSKTFNKQVTHVVFNNGHPATWRKAKKSGVKLVSVLWIGRCYDDGIHVDEELFPALNETNPLLKNKKHRCMQPKDSPERTPENDRRMRKKLDKLMKDLVPKQPLIAEVSPIIIDEESGIVYSPALKRSDYMAQRLKDMKQKRENLSPTASQMLESGSPTDLKPSLGSTPTVLKLVYDESDDDSCASVAEPVHSPDKEEGRAQHDATDHSRIEHGVRAACEKPWLSPCSDVSKRLFSPLTCPGPSNKDVKKRRKSRTLIRKMPSETHNSVDLSENPDCSKNLDEGKIQTQKQSSNRSPKKSEKGKVKVTKSLKETKTRRSSDAVNSVRAAASPKLVSTAVKLSNETSVAVENREQKAPKRARPSLSSLIRSFTASDSKSLASADTDGDDDVFEDYFSPANFSQKSRRPVLPNLPVKTDIVIPFELDSVPKKRKQRRSESIGSESLSAKKKKLERSETDKTHSQQSGASSDPQSDKQLDVKETVRSVKETLLAKRRRQSTLPFTPDVVEPRRSSSALSTMVQDSKTGRGNECTVAAGLAEIFSEGEEIHNKEVSWSLPSMVNKTKAMRTLVMTSMPTEKQHIVDQVVKSLGGFSIVDRVCESTTHVVSGSHRRTLNILLGIARGCWILSFEWILWCLEQRQWVPEEPYELSDHFPAAQICRLQRHLSAGEHQQDLFQRQPAMFVSQHSQPPTQSLIELIQLCGGTVCKSVRQAGICIGRYTGRRPEGSRIVSEQWVLDSITHLKQLSYDNYNLE